MLFNLIGTEWGQGLTYDDAASVHAVQAVIAASPEEASAGVGKQTVELCMSEPGVGLLSRACNAVLSGQRDVEQIGRALISMGHLTEVGKAAGHFLVGYALRFYGDESPRHFELARITYHDVRSYGLEALSAIAVEAAKTESWDTGSAERLQEAFNMLAEADPVSARRLAPGMNHHIAMLGVTRDLIASSVVPATFSLAVTEDCLHMLRFAMFGNLARPSRLTAIARWIQSLRSLSSDSTEELDLLVNVLGNECLWEALILVLRDMIAHGDQRTGTLTMLAQSLSEVGRWPEAKTLLTARVSDHPGPQDIELLRHLVMHGRAASDPDCERWAAMMRTLGSDAPTGAVLRAPEQEEGVRALRPRTAAEDRLADAEKLFRQHQYREAVAVYQEVIQLDPRQEYPHVGLGDAYYRLGEYHMAIAHFTESIAIRATPSAYWFLGDAILRRKSGLSSKSDLEQARRCYEQALALDPACNGARAALEQLLGDLERRDAHGQ